MATEITEEGVIISRGKGKKNTLKADTVVLAGGMKPELALFEALRDRLPEVYPVGDCVQPRLVMHAIWEGFRTARLV